MAIMASTKKTGTYKFYLLKILGDLEPCLRGPFEKYSGTLAAARRHRKKHGDKDGLYFIEMIGNDLFVNNFNDNLGGGRR